MQCEQDRMDIWSLLNPSTQVCLTFPLLCQVSFWTHRFCFLAKEVATENLLGKWSLHQERGIQETQEGNPRDKKREGAPMFCSCPPSPWNLVASMSVFEIKFSWTVCLWSLNPSDLRGTAWAVGLVVLALKPQGWGSELASSGHVHARCTHRYCVLSARDWDRQMLWLLQGFPNPPRWGLQLFPWKSHLFSYIDMHTHF